MAISNSASGFRPGVCTSTTRPQAPYNGQVIYETDTKRTLVWEGSAWVMLTDADQPPGLQLIKTQTIGSGVSSVTVTDAFSAEYDNYRVTLDGMDCSVADYGWVIKFGNSSGNVYFTSITGRNWSNTLVGFATNGGPGGLYGGLTDTQEITSATVDIFHPFLAKYTTTASNWISQNYTGTCGGVHAYAVSQTDLIIEPTGGATLTGGTIRVYGYRKA